RAPRAVGALHADTKFRAARARRSQPEVQPTRAIRTVGQFGCRGCFVAAACVGVPLDTFGRAVQQPEGRRREPELRRAAVVRIAWPDVVIPGTERHRAATDAQGRLPARQEAPARLGEGIVAADAVALVPAQPP